MNTQALAGFLGGLFNLALSVVMMWFALRKRQASEGAGHFQNRSFRVLMVAGSLCWLGLGAAECYRNRYFANTAAKTLIRAKEQLRQEHIPLHTPEAAARVAELVKAGTKTLSGDHRVVCEEMAAWFGEYARRKSAWEKSVKAFKKPGRLELIKLTDRTEFLLRKELADQLAAANREMIDFIDQSLGELKTRLEKRLAHSGTQRDVIESLSRVMKSFDTERTVYEAVKVTTDSLRKLLEFLDENWGLWKPKSKGVGICFDDPVLQREFAMLAANGKQSTDQQAVFLQDLIREYRKATDDSLASQP